MQYEKMSKAMLIETLQSKDSLLAKYQNVDGEYRVLFNSMNEMFQVIELVYDDSGRAVDYYYLEVNPSFERLVSMDKGNIAGKRVKELFGKVDGYWLKAYESVEKTGMPISYEDYGTELDKDFLVRAWKVADKKVAVSFTDITARKRAEIALEQSEQRFRGVFNQAAVGVARVSLDGGWLEVNQKLCEIVGFTQGELLAKSLKDITHPDDLMKDLDNIDQLIAGKIRTYCIEKRYYHKGGEFIWINLSVALVRDSGGKPDYFIAVIEDISTRKDDEKIILDAVKQAEVDSRAKSVFLSNITHDLRTPLNSIMGMAEILSENNMDDQLRTITISSLIKSGENLLQIIDDVIDLAKVESENLLLDKTLFNLIDFIHSVIDLFELSIKKKGIEIHTDIASDLPLVIWEDEHTLRRVLTNLISNAVKFTHRGNVKIVITRSNSMIIFSIKDTGIGILEENLDKITKAFDQEDSSITRRFGGSGLGLTIVKNFVHLMEGEFWIKSKKDIGSEFCFSLPLVTPPISRYIDKPMIESTSVTNGELLPLRVLLADDSPENCTLIELFLKKHPVQLDAAEDGEVAVEKYKANRKEYDLILMDLQMPVMSGYEAVSAIRKWECEHSYSHVPIVALSASVMEEEVAKALSCGCDLHMAKPIKKQVLLNQLLDISSIKHNCDFIVWNNTLSVGNLAIDLEHQKIFNLINQLRQGIGSKDDEASVLKLVNEMVECFTAHFQNEENLFVDSQYPGKDKHRKKHQQFMAQIEQKLLGLSQKTISPVHVILSVKAWVVEHICKYDQEYKFFIASKL